MLRVLHGCFKGVRSQSQGCQGALHWHFKGVTKVLQECYKGVIRVLQRIYEDVVRVFWDWPKRKKDMLIRGGAKIMPGDTNTNLD